MRKRAKLGRYGPEALVLLSGLLIVAAFPPHDRTWLIAFCLVPWFFALEAAPSIWVAVRHGFLLSAVMTLGGFFWAYQGLRLSLGLSAWAAGAGFLLFMVVGQLQFAVFGALYKAAELRWKRSGKTPPGIALLLALAYTGIDWALPKLFKDTLGHALYRAETLRQLADLGGSSLLTCLIFWVNYVTFEILSTLRDYKRRGIPAPNGKLFRQIAMIGVVGVAVAVYGNARLHQIQAWLQAARNSLQIAVIQGAVSPKVTFAAHTGNEAAMNEVFRAYLQLSERAALLRPKPEALVWPEMSYPQAFGHPSSPADAERDHQLQAFEDRIRIPIVLGGYDFEGWFYNALFLFSAGSGPQKYRKHHLIPFGEYIPDFESFSLIRKWLPPMPKLLIGRGPSTMSLASVPIAPALCYEILFPDYLIEEARLGSRLILNLSEETWSGGGGEPALHFALATFRSLETRLSMVRAASSGISALVLPTGEILETVGPDRPAIMNVRVPLPDPSPTLMKRWGDWFGPFSLLLGLGGICAFGLNLANARIGSYNDDRRAVVLAAPRKER